MSRLAASLAAALALPALAACGGGGGRGGGGGGPTTMPTPTPVTAAITFTASGTGGANSLALTRISSDANTLVLSLEATSVNDFYGLAFDLVYPSAVLELDDVTEGTFLDQNGTVNTSLQVAESPAGRVIVGLSRLGAVAGRSGSGSLLRVELRRRATGSGELRFERNQAFNSAGAAIGGVAWSAGTVAVP